MDGERQGGRRRNRGRGRGRASGSGWTSGREQAGREGTGRSRQRADTAKAIEADPEQAAHTIALQQLTIQPRTREELAKILARKGIPDDAARKVLARLEDVRLIDDEAYAHAWVESRHTGRGLARKALAYELRKRGVGDEIVEEAVEVVDTDAELTTARALVERKLYATRNLETSARVRRLAGMLARKGYSGAIAFRVIREALDEEGIEAPSDLEALDDL